MGILLFSTNKIPILFPQNLTGKLTPCILIYIFYKHFFSKQECPIYYMVTLTKKGYRIMKLNCKPCRVVHCYKIENGTAHIIGFDGVIRLNESATIIWNMSNGKNSLKDILGELQKIYDTIPENELYKDLEAIINILSDKGILVKDWDPLLKDKISLKENFI